MTSADSMQSSRFPTTPDKITPAWLTQVWRDGEIGGDIAEVETVPIGEGFGQTGMAARVMLRYAAGASGPASVIAKLATTDAHRRAYSASMGIYAREVNFYQSLAPKIKVRTPRCYFADVAADGQTFLLLLEDLNQHRSGDETLGCTAADAILAVTEAARLHAPMWESDFARALGEFPHFPREVSERSWSGMVETFGDYVPASVRALREKYIDAIPELQRWMNASPLTVAHGDFRLDNLMFGTGPTMDPIVVLDWQGIRPAKGIQDIAYLVSHSVITEERRANEIAILEAYVGELNRGGVTYTMAQCEQDYRKAMLYLFAYVIAITGMMVNPHERALRRKRRLLERSIAAMNDWNAFDLLSSMK